MLAVEEELPRLDPEHAEGLRSGFPFKERPDVQRVLEKGDDVALVELVEVDINHKLLSILCEFDIQVRRSRFAS